MRRSKWNSKIVIALQMLLTFVATANAEDQEQQEKRYGKHILAEWQQIVKSTNFKTLGQPEFVNGLIEIVVDEKAGWASRRQAAKTLGRIGEPAARAVPELIKVLENPGEDVDSTRLWALGALSLFKTVAREAAPVVSKIILDENQPHLVRVNAMETLGRVGKESEITLATFSAILKQSPSDSGSSQNDLRLAAAEAVWILGPSAVPLLPLLIDNARDEWSAIRLAALTSIGQIGPLADIAIPTLVDAILFDESAAVKEVAADSLGKMGGAAIPIISKLQRDREDEVRQYMIRAINQMSNDSDAMRLLDVSLTDESANVAVAAADEYLRRDSTYSAAQNLLLNMLDHSDRRVRLEAYNSAYQDLLNSESMRKKIESLAESETASKLSRSTAHKLLRKFKFSQE